MVRMKAVAIALMCLWMSASPASAHILEPWSSNEGIGVYVGYTWHRSGDTIEAWSSALWSTTRASNLHHDADEGRRFTMNADDLNNNLNATGQSSTNYWDPSYDKDDDNADLKYEEAEITAQGIDFPVANNWYYANLRFSHSYYAFGEWRYDSGGGTVQFDESLSEQLWWTGDLWDTTYCCAVWNNRVSYPSRAAGAVASASPTNVDADLIVQKMAASHKLEAFEAKATSDPGEVRLVPDLSAGLAKYRERTTQLGTALVESGPAHGILTFDRPVQPVNLERLSKRGVMIMSIEAVTSADQHGDRWTVFSANEPGFWTYMQEEAANAKADLLGITAIDVVVPNGRAFESVVNDPSVYLLDLSLEQYERSHPKATDVVMNDVYWHHAGWAR